eukprot:6631617-Pyramimonas_sp.AAC.1
MAMREQQKLTQPCGYDSHNGSYKCSQSLGKRRKGLCKRTSTHLKAGRHRCPGFVPHLNARLVQTQNQGRFKNVSNIMNLLVSEAEA